MAVNYITLKGYVRNGKLEVELPENVTEGEAEIIVPVAAEPDYEKPILGDEPPLTDEEIDDLLRRKPGMTGAEIVAAGLTGTWKHKGIEDSVTWVKEQRRKRRNA